jgi:hypothetical protein
VSTRRWYVNQALASFKSLTAVLDDLTENEVIAALELESASSRRMSIIDRLISRAIRLREISYGNTLKEKYRGSSQQTGQDVAG